MMAKVLWWGRTERNYSRNRIVRHLFEQLGWQVCYFHPLSSALGLMESLIRRPERSDLIFVPCFRHRDIASAAFWSRRWQVPLILDPLISAYEKETFERQKWPQTSYKAEQRRLWESRLFASGDVVVADTAAHANFFHQRLAVPRQRLQVLYVGAEPGLFEAQPLPEPKPPYELLFYGSFLELHGVDVIIEAAKRLNDHNIRWVLLGDGALKARMVAMAGDAPTIHFEPWIPYNILPDRMARAHIMLGIFGPTVLNDLVIPNKMFQSMAIGRPIITSRSEAYRDSLEGDATIGWVKGGDPDDLAGKVHAWLSAPHRLAKRGSETRTLFDRYFSIARQAESLAMIIHRALGENRPNHGAPNDTDSPHES
ncbi:MAG: glycosyltransferase [Desulfatitalea sp.]|nr:glycosyltransferase [Desulfatitalea sp.]NNK00890.1 glycosyltransferase [Desulfatitalea sp.]